MTAPGRNRRAAPRPARASPSPLQIARVGEVPTGPENPLSWQFGWFPPENPPAGPGETGHVRKIWPTRAIVYPSEAEPVLPLHTYSRRTRSKLTQGVKHPQDAQIGSHELHSRTNSRCVSIHYDEQAESRSRRAESPPKSRARPVAPSSNAPVAGRVDASSACRLSGSVPRLSSCSGSRESLNNPMFAVSRGRGGLDVKLDDIADRPGAALVTGYGANGRYPRRSASFPAVPPAAGRLLPCHPVA